MAFFSQFKAAYKAFFSSWNLYWSAYGGFRALLRSPYLHISIVISALCWNVWLKSHESWAWFNLCLDIMPNLLGFTLGGYAILLAFGDEKFRKILTGKSKEEKYSPYVELNATFLHFIVMQTASIFFALIGFSWDLRAGIFSFFGFLIFVYALSLAFAAAHGILKLVDLSDFISSN